jgi:hypothetical protein
MDESCGSLLRDYGEIGRLVVIDDVEVESPRPRNVARLIDDPSGDRVFAAWERL